MKQTSAVILIICIASCSCSAVNSKIVKHKSLSDFSDGKTENAIITSKGEISLSLATETLAKDFSDVWTINSIVCKDDNAIFIGTSPNGKIFKYKDGKTTLIYPAEKPEEKEANEPNNPPRRHLANEHIFKLALDKNDRLLAAVSGQKGQLMRYDGKNFETIFESNQSPYIFAVTLDGAGNIYIGTGPRGQIWKLSSSGKDPQLLYTAQDKNILCLVADEKGFLYAGTDSRGLIYKIDIKNKNAVVLYDSEENEINDLLFDEQQNLYAAATSYKSITAQLRDSDRQPQKSFTTTNTPQQTEKEEPDPEICGQEQAETNAPPAEDTFQRKQMPMELERGQESSKSRIYKIDPRGFVTEVFSRNAVFFKMFCRQNQILLGTGNKAELFSINPDAETDSLYYQDNQASQITDITKFAKDIVFATANPAKLIKLKSSFAQTGTFESTLIDAGQPAMWGKLQIVADIPQNTEVKLSARTGNIGDLNDPAFSPWTKAVPIKGPTDLNVPLGRFCQYKLILSGNETSSPVIRQAAVAFVVPNLPPKITDIFISKEDKKSGTFKINFRADDANWDKLVYNIDFRKKGRTAWIQLAKDLDKTSFEWNSKTVEDGIYEFKVTAFDKLSNDSETSLSGEKISDQLTVDNTAPTIECHELKIDGRKAFLSVRASDLYSTISSFECTIDSNENWDNVLPEDGVFDTQTESFKVKTDELKPGEHIIAVKITDAEDNTMYKTFEININ